MPCEHRCVKSMLARATTAQRRNLGRSMIRSFQCMLEYRLACSSSGGMRETSRRRLRRQ